MRDRIEGNNWHLDVDSVEPKFSIRYFRKSVHFMEPHASWVQIDVNQFGLFNMEIRNVCKTSTQGLV